MSEFRTDALRPAGLPSANLGRPRALVSGPSTTATDAGEGSSKNKFWDDWNKRIDGEVKAVAEGLGELVELSDISKTPIPHAPSLISLHLPLRTSQLIKATQQLRDTAHELRLMLLLSDEVDIALKRDEEARRTRKSIQQARGDVVGSLRRLMGAHEEPPDSGGEPRVDDSGTKAEPAADAEKVDGPGTNGASHSATRIEGPRDAMELDEDGDEDEDEEGDFEEVG